SFGSSYNSTIYIPYNTYTQRFQHVNLVGGYEIKVKDGFDPRKVSSDCEAFLDELVGSDNYFLISSATLADMVSSVTSTLSIFLAAIGGISLLVGGIGIMNIMLVSVAERTKEIGIRKALGASPSVIKRQFLTEAITLTSIGGVIGILLGIGISKLVTNIAGWGFSVSVTACVLSVGFSTATGVFFGLYPAAKAAKLDPIDSLNYE
ncbi:MAG: FtsX-like permease family protein, partial [Spirochaetales bacterium]|nr:FtsX-like permease family protein [Spirochaetales bacterium]